MIEYRLEIKNEIAIIFSYRKIKIFYYIVQHSISGYGFYTKASTHICLRYATANIRYAETLYEIIKSNMSREEREKQFGPYAEQQKILEKFQEQRHHIEKITGLTLSNIEAIGLRKITEEVMRQMVREGIDGVDGFNVADPIEEIPARFFQEFFDIPVGQFSTLFPEDQPKIREEWFRREQEKRHLI